MFEMPLLLSYFDKQTIEPRSNPRFVCVDLATLAKMCVELKSVVVRVVKVVESFSPVFVT